MFGDFRESMIVKKVPKWIVNRTRDNMDRFNMDLNDAFQEAVRSYPKPSKELAEAFYRDDFSEYIPSAYIPRPDPAILRLVLDFCYRIPGFDNKPLQEKDRIYNAFLEIVGA